MAVATQPAGERLVEGLRGTLQLAAPTQADLIVESLVEAIKTTKRVKGHCTKCDGWVTVQVQDATAATNAIKFLVETTEGRPGVADAAEQEQLVINRTVYTTVSAEQALALLDAGDLDALRAELQSSL